MIAWTIDAASKSKYVDCVLVSTDSESIANIARRYGAWVPSLRDAHLAKDDSSVIDVVKNAISEAESHGKSFEYIALLQPTSPLRNTEHIDRAFEKLVRSSTADDTLVSVKRMDDKLNWVMGRDKESGYLYSLNGLDMTNPRRQELPTCYLPNGAIYMARSESFSGFYNTHTLPFIMDGESSIDIDYLEDFERATDILSKK